MIKKITPPRDALLAKKIEFFYQYSNVSGKRKYYTYPNNHCFLTVALNAKKTIRGNEVYLEEDEKSGLNQVFVGPIGKRFKVTYHGNVNVLSICFKPLHIHSFLDEKLSLHNNTFIPNSGSGQFLPPDLVMDEIKNEGADRFVKLERFLLTKLNGFKKPKIEKAIELIESSPNYKIEDIAQELDLSMKSLISNFKKYVGRTPLEYRRVHKFRLALISDEKKLSQVCYESNYFDQSHMIKDFYKFGKQPPREVLKRENLSGITDVQWLKA